MASTAHLTNRGEAMRRAQGGFTYLGLMLIIAGIGLVLASTAQVWVTVSQREKETELLFIGNQFRKALTRYAAGSTNPNEPPRTLDQLVKDVRFSDTRRYLRKVFVDPMTGKREWGLLRDKAGGIMGVYSTSEAKPLKVANFSTGDRDFEGKTKYSQWVFMPKQAGVTSTGAQPGTAGSSGQGDFNPNLPASPSTTDVSPPGFGIGK